MDGVLHDIKMSEEITRSSLILYMAGSSVFPTLLCLTLTAYKPETYLNNAPLANNSNIKHQIKNNNNYNNQSKINC